MSVRTWLNSVSVLVAATFLLAASTSAQSNEVVKVSDAIEGGGGGTTSARCGNDFVVGFGDAEPSNQNSFDGIAVSKNVGKTFRDVGVLPISDNNTVGDGTNDNFP